MADDVLLNLEKLWRRQRYEYLTGSRIICKTPGFLVCAKMTGTVAATTTIDIYDGESANEEQVCKLSAIITGSDQMSPSMPIPFKRGLYATFGAGATSLMVVIITVKE